MSDRLLDLMIVDNVITDEQAKKAIEEKDRIGASVKTGEVLIRLKFVTPAQVYKYLRKQKKIRRESGCSGVHAENIELLRGSTRHLDDLLNQLSDIQGQVATFMGGKKNGVGNV